MRNQQGKRVQFSRMIGYTINAPEGLSFDEDDAERLLRRAEKEGVIGVGEWDTGRGHLVWFNGRPGAALRDLRRQLQDVVESAR